MSEPTVTISTLLELHDREQDLVERINRRRNGGAMFLAHPLRMLRDLGVRLTPDAVAELTRLEPAVARGSDTAYEVLRDAAEEGPVRVRLTGGLFRRGAP